MRGNISITLFIIFLLILLGVGFGLGYFWTKKQTPICPPSLLESKVLRNWMTFANGTVKEISGRDLILAANGETLKISVSEGAKFQSLNPETKEMQKADFEDIKVGGKVEIQLSVTSEKVLIGHLVTILH
jgi:hypothetical protein